MKPQVDKDFNLKNYFCIPSFYDSHLHFEGIGKYHSKNNLSQIKSIQDLENHVIQNISLKENYIEGFGLSSILVKDLPLLVTRLKKYVNEHNFYFVLEDGHQLLFFGSALDDYLETLNSDQMKLISRHENLAIFNDISRPQFDEYYLKLRSKTKPTELDSKTKSLSTAQNILLKNGITHFRDMTSDPDQLLVLLGLEKNKKLIVFPELFYSNFFGENIDSLIKKSIDGQLQCQNQKSKIVHRGLKIFLDGTFSQGNADTIASSLWKECGCSILEEDLNNEDKSSSNHTHSAKESLSQKDIEDLLKLVSDSNIEIAFHTIGDLAVEKVIQAFENVKFRFKTQLHLEHCELINSKTFRILKNLKNEDKNKITFHFQPSHYLMDKKQLDMISSLYPDLHILDWPNLSLSGFKVFFGSDAPVTDLGLGYLNQLRFESLFLKNYSKVPYWSFFNHPQYRTSPNTFTLFKNLKVENVFVQGQKII